MGGMSDGEKEEERDCKVWDFPSLRQGNGLKNRIVLVLGNVV